MTDQFEFEPLPVTPTVTTRKRNPLDMVLVGAAIVALAGVAFATGRLTAPAAAVTAANGQIPAGGTGALGPGGGRTRGSFDPNASFPAGQGGFGGQGPAGAGGLGGLGGLGGGVNVTGSVTAVSATQITVQLANGTVINIPIDATTVYHAQASATSSDVKTGTKVEIQVGAAGRIPNASGAPVPNASGAPQGANLGTASSITIIP